MIGLDSIIARGDHDATVELYPVSSRKNLHVPNFQKGRTASINLSFPLQRYGESASLAHLTDYMNASFHFLD